MSDPKRVLIVDDSMVMRAMIKDVLTKDGYNVVGQAKNGKEALEAVPQAPSRPGHDGHHHAG